MYLFKNQVELFYWIATNRPHISEISGEPIPNILNGDQQSWCFMHVLGKGAYPKFKLYYKNIMLVLPEEHVLWDNHQSKARADRNYDFVFELAEVLRREYHTTPLDFKPCYKPHDYNYNRR